MNKTSIDVCRGATKGDNGYFVAGNVCPGSAATNDLHIVECGVIDIDNIVTYSTLIMNDVTTVSRAIETCAVDVDCIAAYDEDVIDIVRIAVNNRAMRGAIKSGTTAEFYCVAGESDICSGFNRRCSVEGSTMNNINFNAAEFDGVVGKCGSGETISMDKRATADI